MVESRAIEKRLKEAFALVADSLAAAGYLKRVRDAYQLIDANESAIALENMCENLYECECRVPAKAYEIFVEVGAYLKVDNRYLEMLRPNVVV